MKRVFWILALLLVPSLGWGATYYVSQSGTGDGSAIGTPASVATFNAGTAPFDDLDDDTVYFLDTITTTIAPADSGTSGHVITLRGDYPSRGCTCEGSDVLSGSWTDAGGGLWTISLTGNPRYLWLDGKFAVVDASTDDDEEWTHDNVSTLTMKSSSQPATRYTEIRYASRANGIDISNHEYITVTGFTFSRLCKYSTTLDQYGAGAVRTNNGSNNTVTSCTFSNCSTAVSFGSASNNCVASYNTVNGVYGYSSGKNYNGIAFWSYGANNLIHHNTVVGKVLWTTGYQNAGEGVRLHGADGQWAAFNITGSSVYSNNISYMYWYGVCVWDRDTTDGIQNVNVAIYDNIISYVQDVPATDSGDHDGIGNGGTGSTDGNHWTGIYIYRNKVSECSNAGIHNANAMGAGGSIRYNVVINCGLQTTSIGGIRTANGTDVFNNIVYGSATGHGIRGDNDTVTGADPTEIKNNIIVGIDSSAKYGIYVDVEADATGSNNCIFDVPTGKETYNFTNTNGITSDPLFANASSYDFRLKPGSPCINTGTDVSLTTDYMGQTVPCRGVIDISAIEACYHLWLVGE
jgi:hypothetical protein